MKTGQMVCAGGQSSSCIIAVADTRSHGRKDLFEEWLTVHAPGDKEKILNRIRAIRDGKLNDPNFNTRMVGSGVFADQIAKTFAVACRKVRISGDFPELSVSGFRRPAGKQFEMDLQ